MFWVMNDGNAGRGRTHDEKRIWIITAVLLLAVVCAWVFADGPWVWTRKLTAEDIRSAAAWAHVPEWEQAELSGEDAAKLAALLGDLDRDDFRENRQMGGSTPGYGILIETADVTYRIDQSIAPCGELEISCMGDDRSWWIDDDELAAFVKSVLPERLPDAGERVEFNDWMATALECMRGLHPEEIGEIQYRETDLAELTALIRAASAHDIQRTEDLRFAAWDMTVSLSANTEEDWALESIWFGAGPEEEEIVQVGCRFRDDPYDRTLFLEDGDLYWFIRNGYSTEEVIDEETIVTYRDILEKQARKTMDEYGRLLGVQNFFWCEILSFELVDSFRQNGEDYAVYEWDVAFLTKDPAKVGWEGGMWLDNQCRVRALEEKTYFVIRSSKEPAYSSAMVDYRFFSQDLYSVLDEETGNAYARTAITEAFRSDLDMRIYCLNLQRESVRRSDQEFNHALEQKEEPMSYIWIDEKGESPLAAGDGELLSAISSAADYLQAIEQPDSLRIPEGGFYVVLDSSRYIALFAGEEPYNVFFRYVAPDVDEAAVVYDPQLYLYLAASAERIGADLTDLDHDGSFEAVFGDRSSGSLIVYDYYENEIHRIDTNQTIGCVASTHSLPANIQNAYNDMIQAQSADGTVSVYSYKDGTFVYEGLLKDRLRSEP